MLYNRVTLCCGRWSTRERLDIGRYAPIPAAVLLLSRQLAVKEPMASALIGLVCLRAHLKDPT
jgi:hypothetical protein